MKIGLLCAGDMELMPVLAMLKVHHTAEKAMLKFYEGELAGVNTVTLFSGVCKVNAAIAAQHLIDAFGCDAIINTGTAGGMADYVDIFDIVVSTECAYHDVSPGILTDFHPWLPSVFFPADPLLLSAAHKAAAPSSCPYTVHFGRVMTGEQFITDAERPPINAAYAPLSVDMESTAVAHVCHVNRVPFLSIRSITDNSKHSGGDTFYENCPKAAQIAAEFTRDVLSVLKEEYHLADL